MFKRRDRRSVGRIVGEAVWPRGGWGRALTYLRHRMQRLPGTPENIARGIAAGVFTTYTPFYGFHFVISYLLARLVRGNGLAAMLATLFGNPLTYVPIAFAAVRTGEWMLGREPLQIVPRFKGDETVWTRIADAWDDLWRNFKAMFTPAETNWSGLFEFWDTIVWPWTVGSVIPGVISGVIAYYLCLPLIRAYQKSRLARKQQPKFGADVGQAGE